VLSFGGLLGIGHDHYRCLGQRWNMTRTSADTSPGSLRMNWAQLELGRANAALGRRLLWGAGRL